MTQHLVVVTHVLFHPTLRREWSIQLPHGNSMYQETSTMAQIYKTMSQSREKCHTCSQYRLKQQKMVSRNIKMTPQNVNSPLHVAMVWSVTGTWLGGAMVGRSLLPWELDCGSVTVAMVAAVLFSILVSALLLSLVWLLLFLLTFPSTLSSGSSGLGAWSSSSPSL